MRTRACLFMIKQSTHEVLLIKSMNSDYQYYVLPGGRVGLNENSVETIMRKAQDELNIYFEKDNFDFLGEFNFQGNPQYCYITYVPDEQPDKQEIINSGNFTFEWVPFNTLASKLPYIASIVDRFLEYVSINSN